MNVPAAETINPIIIMYLDSKNEENLAPSIEKSKMAIEAGKRASPV